MNLKHDWPLFLGVGLPLLMIIVVALSILLPAASAHPQYDFIYTYNDYCWPQEFYVNNGKVTETPENHPGFIAPAQGQINTAPIPAPQPRICTSPKPALYLHSTKANTNLELTLSQAGQYNLNTDTISPDGYQVIHGSTDSFFGGGNNYNQMYLKGHGVAKKITLQNSYANDAVQFTFLGWIAK